MTTREEELQEIKKTEINTNISVTSKHQTLGGVQFPVSDAAKDAIHEMSKGLHNYLQFKIGDFFFMENTREFLHFYGFRYQ